MSIREVTMYRVVCDWPGCGASAQDGTENYAWRHRFTALDDAANDNWWEGRSGESYCTAHPRVWLSDVEDGQPYPAPPYLLVSDEGDGYATYVAGEAEYRDVRALLVAGAAGFAESMRQWGDLAAEVVRREWERWLGPVRRPRDPMAGPGHRWSSRYWSARHEESS